MEKTLLIDDRTARKIYPSAAPELKAILDDTFTKGFFSQTSMDRIKTFEDACAELSEDPKLFEVGLPDEIAYKKLKVIARALNGNWKPDWDNSNQRKWAPWFYLNAPGFRFYASNDSTSTSLTTGGSRLCFETEELANYAAKQFLELYKALLA